MQFIIKDWSLYYINTARKASSYTGVCPFPNVPGKIVEKAKTSPFEDKKLKALLYMDTKSAVKHSKK